MIARWLACCVFSMGARAGAQNLHCTKPDGEGILFIGPSFYRATHGYDAHGTRYSNPATFSRSQLGAYVEYGATADLTLIANLAVVRLSSVDARTSHQSTGLSNPEFAFAAAVERLPFIGRLFCAAGLALKLPVVGQGDPLIGFAQTDIEGRLRQLGALNLWSYNGYWVTDVALRYRSGAPADEFRFNALGALRYTPNWTAMLSAVTVTGLRNGSPIAVNNNYTLDPDYSSYQVQAAALYRSARTRFEQIGISQEVAGRNSGSGTTISLVIWQYF